MGFLKLFETASVPVLNVLLVTSLGSFIATDYVGILNEDARKHLNNVVFYVSNPALITSNLARTVTLDSVVSLWFMPVNILLTYIFGSAFGWIVIQVTRTPRRFRGLILGCCSAGNMGNMLLILLPAVCKERGSPFGAPDVCHAYGLEYASLSLAIGAFVLWLYVYNIMRLSTNAIEDEDNLSNNYQASTMDIPEEQRKLLSGNSQNYSIPSNSVTESELPLSVSEGSTEAKVTLSGKLREILLSVSLAINFRKLFAPSTIAVIVGFIFGLIPQMKKALIGERAPLRVIQESSALVGDVAIPTLTLILGGNLIKGLRGSGIHFSLVLGVVVVRYVLSPLLGIVIVKGAIRLGLVHNDPLYQFVLLLQYSMPPAMNIGTITQWFGTGESECSVIFLWTYALASVALTLWAAFFMWLVK